MRKTQQIKSSLSLLMAAALTLGAANTSAALIEVDQTIWGMDCAPCAWSMEKALKKLGAVEHVTVSLNKGDAVLKFAAENHVTLAQIQQTVRNSGFTPKSATVKVSGTLKREAGQLRLAVGKASYLLKPSNAAKDSWQQLQRAAQGATVMMVGRIAAHHAGQMVVLKANRVVRQVFR